MTNEDKIKKWLAGELSEAERKEFESTEEFKGISKILEAVNHFKAPEYDVQGEYGRLTENIRRSWKRSSSRNTPDKKKTISLADRMRPVLKIAAILVIALTAGYFIYHQFLPGSDSQQWIAEQTEVYLPDSSLVSLNTASRIRFSEKKWENERNVELSGEAFFSVKEGVQFTVQTAQGLVTVLGTEFSVKDREGFFEVTCYSGSVNVATPHRSVVLQPQSSYRMINGKEENFIYSGKSAPDWFREESSFRSVPLKFVIDELELQYNVSVETEDVDINQLFTGSFSHKNLEIALKAITFPVNLHYEINENLIVLTVEGK